MYTKIFLFHKKRIEILQNPTKKIQFMRVNGYLPQRHCNECTVSFFLVCGVSQKSVST